MPHQVITVKPKMANSVMPIQTKVAAAPSIRKTGIDQTWSQTTRVELMPFVYMAVSTVSNTVSAVTACTGAQK